jgi:prevent-host-death family protein
VRPGRLVPSRSSRNARRPPGPCRPGRPIASRRRKAKILSLLDAVAAGEEIEITKHGRTVARLVPAKGPHALKGKLTGVAMSSADDEELFSTGATWDLP